ncbi:carboxypeptidase regulatory-like domain-containing protein [Oceanithermus sp.]
MNNRIGLLTIVLLLSLALFGCGSGVPRGNATLEGTVVDATTAQPVPSASVCMLYLGTEAICDVTGSDGGYRLENLPAGSQTFRIRAEGHTTYEQQIELTDGEVTTSDFAANPEITGGEWRIVLSWGEDPSDLDSHLWVPLSATSTYEVFYANKGDCQASPWACLDVDDTTSYGPETITISQFTGTYPYAVHWYDGTGSWAGSDATVRVYNSSGLVREFSVPNDTTHFDDSWWYVFDISSSGIVTVYNQVQNDPPLSSSASVQKVH